MKRVLVIGASGMVGSRFMELASKDFDLVPSDEKTLDITDKQAVDKYFLENKFDSAINFSAYTNVGEGENDRDNKNGIAWKLNTVAPGHVAEACLKNNIFLVHISTDMVFPGSKEDPGPYAEDHLIPPDSSVVTWYGYTKGLGEASVVKILGNKACILRLIYPFRSRFSGKPDYLRKPIQLYEEGKLYPLFTDQKLTTVFVDDICKILKKIIEKNQTGILHASCTDVASPYDHVSYALEKIKGKPVELKTGLIEEFLKTATSPVRYPQFGGLNTLKTQNMLNLKFRTWKEMVDEFVLQIKNINT